MNGETGGEAACLVQSGRGTPFDAAVLKKTSKREWRVSVRKLLVD